MLKINEENLGKIVVSSDAFCPFYSRSELINATDQ
jgi:hypothetical protein